MVLAHRRELTKANLIAILGAVVSVPIPLLIPLLVDEVLLHKPGVAVATMNRLFPESWHQPLVYILLAAGIITGWPDEKSADFRVLLPRLVLGSGWATQIRSASRP